jgi:alkanesulfonate monooxygenase
LVGIELMSGFELRVYATCPQSKDVDVSEYKDRVADVARWSEEAGCHGILVYTDNGIADPWLVAQQVIEATERLRPLVAVQSVYMSPYSVAKMVTTLAYLHGRAVDLNMVAGGFRNDLLALGDETPHDDRYNRVIEYTRIITGLLKGESVTFEGRFYSVKNLRLTPPLPAELAPGLTISGSSPAGLAAAEEIGALAVRYPKPVADEEKEHPSPPPGGLGVRLGIVARESAEDAWKVARERFPEDRHGEVKHQLAMKVSDSHWHRDLGERDDGEPDEANPYWLGPFKQGQTFCPYLVGSHDRVGAELGRYIGAGFATFILDIPPDREELEHTDVVFKRGVALAK